MRPKATLRRWFISCFSRRLARLLSRPLSCSLSCLFAGLEALARPCDLNHRAMIGEGPVGKRDFCPGALQQRAGDEYAETEACVFACGVVRAAPARQIGLADPLQDIGREPGPVVGDD